MLFRCVIDHTCWSLIGRRCGRTSEITRSCSSRNSSDAAPREQPPNSWDSYAILRYYLWSRRGLTACRDRVNCSTRQTAECYRGSPLRISCRLYRMTDSRLFSCRWIYTKRFPKYKMIFENGEKEICFISSIWALMQLGDKSKSGWSSSLKVILDQCTDENVVILS